MARVWRVAPATERTSDYRRSARVFAGWEGCEGGELDLGFEVGDFGAAVAELGAGAGGLDSPCVMKSRSMRGEFAVEVGGGHTAVHEEVAAVDERADGTQEERADGPDLVRSTSPIRRRYPSPRGPVSSSLASGVMMMPGLIVLIRAPRLLHRTASAITRSAFPRLAS